MEKRKSFADCDDLAGWENSKRDFRLWKYLRPHDVKVGDTVLKDTFKFVKKVKLPPSYLVDSTGLETNLEKDMGDVYEAFWRTEKHSIRGVFANGEPVWGTAEYSNGMTYTGSFKDCLPDGFGEKRMGASVFKGQFKGGMRHGRGVFLDASHFRLYAGTFVNDQPHGDHLCILYNWSETKKHATHSRNLLGFQHGVLIKMEKDVMEAANVNTLSGLVYEEFLKFYREGEKCVEDFVARQRLADIGAEPFLWQPVRSEATRQTAVVRPEVKKQVNDKAAFNHRGATALVKARAVVNRNVKVEKEDI